MDTATVTENSTKKSWFNAEYEQQLRALRERRHSQIIAAWKANPHWSLRECGEYLGITRERVRQVLKLHGIMERYRMERVPQPIKLSKEEKIAQRKAKFWSFVGITLNPDDCWLWQGTIGKELGYGRFYNITNTRQSRRHLRAQEIAYYLTYGSLNDWIVNMCRNPTCVNPKHLQSMSPVEAVAFRDQGRLPGTFRKLDFTAAKEARKKHQRGFGIRDLAAEYGVSRSAMYNVLIGKTFSASRRCNRELYKKIWSYDLNVSGAQVARETGTTAAVVYNVRCGRTANDITGLPKYRRSK